MSTRAGDGKTPVQIVSELYTAIRDGRMADVLALVDPEVICMPLVRPGLAQYEGHDGMTRLVGDLHAAYGRYRIAIVEAAEDGPRVTVRATLTPEPGRGEPVPVTTAYTLRHGLIFTIESFAAGQDADSVL
jgi:SnoaL-like domain